MRPQLSLLKYRLQLGTAAEHAIASKLNELFSFEAVFGAPVRRSHLAGTSAATRSLHLVVALGAASPSSALHIIEGQHDILRNICRFAAAPLKAGAWPSAGLHGALRCVQVQLSRKHHRLV